jgi:uncharacterized protein (DUF1499 family)
MVWCAPSLEGTRMDPGPVGPGAQGRSLAAVLASSVAAAAAALAIGGPLLANLGAVRPLAGFGMFALGGLLALAGLVLGAFGLRATRAGREGRGRAWFAVAVGAAVLAALLSGALGGRGLPRINDITTSPDDPPVFEAAAREEANRERDMAYPADFAAQQRAGYPDLAPIALDLPPAEAFERARRAAAALGWQVTMADPARGVLEARSVSRLFRFVDDVAIRVRPAGAGSVVDVRSKSRDGRGDLGANAARIRAFAAELAGGAGAG